MNYLIVTNTYEPFYTNWFIAENNWIEGCEMVVFNLMNHTYTTNGKDWHKTTQDHL
jgi:hypothetical protein